MPKIHVIIDSTAGMPTEVFAGYDNLHEVSLKINLGSEEFNEREINNQRIVDWVAITHQFPFTSQPSLGDFKEVIEPLLADNSPIIIITISAALSGTYFGANAVAKELDPNRIKVVSSGTVGYPMRVMAMKAIELAEQGVPFCDIVTYIEKMAKATHTIFIPNNLNYLHKGGRIGGAATLIGNILQIKPILYLVDQKVSVLDKVRTRRRAIERMVEEVKRYNNLDYLEIVYIVEKDTEELRSKIGDFYFGKVTVTECSPVVAVHVGPTIGVMFQERLL